ncbi:TonB-dependent receptor [Hymenobacter oligotrophus]|nr:hypothetical protein [Hymenobacter oligotrophus]
MPHSANVPVLGAKGAAELRGSTGLNGTEVQGAWAATNHLALTAGGLRYASGRDTRFRSAEVGLGYYAWPGNEVMLAVYAGAGYGSGRAATSGFEGGRETDIRSRYLRPYIQPTLVWQPTERWHLGLAWQVNQVHYLRLLETTRTSAPTPFTVERNGAGLWQTQHQVMLTSSYWLSARWRLVVRVGGAQAGGQSGVAAEPWPLVANLGLTVRLGNAR